jgi:hypothetical protein
MGSGRPSSLSSYRPTRPLAAVVGAGGTAAPAVVSLPGGVALTIPGQGDGSMLEAAGLPGRQAATTVANLLGVWVPNHATLEPEALAAVVDRAGDRVGARPSGARSCYALETKQGRALVRAGSARDPFASGVTGRRPTCRFRTARPRSPVC